MAKGKEMENATKVWKWQMLFNMRVIKETLKICINFGNIFMSHENDSLDCNFKIF